MLLAKQSIVAAIATREAKINTWPYGPCTDRQHAAQPKFDRAQKALGLARRHGDCNAVTSDRRSWCRLE
nr:hypothetical protein CFP56_25923 [Quercus suber]